MLSKNHIRLLKKISKNKVIRTDKNNKDLDYLLEKEYIKITVADKPGDYFAQPYLTEKGEARLYKERKGLTEFWVPLIISNVIATAALITSIISLLK